MTENTSRTAGDEADRGSGPADGAGAPVILSNKPGSFAWGVLAKRHPAMIQQVRDAFPYGCRQHEALDALLDEITNGVIEQLAPTELDHWQWSGWGRDYFGGSWFDAPFLWAESYFYRRLLGAIEYFGTGPWRGVDPFAPFTQAELRSAAAGEELRDALADVPADERSTAVLHASLWGNRADLGFRVTAGEPTLGDADPGLVADDSVALWSLLPPGGLNTVAMVADNAGRELIPDLILIDHLLEYQHAEQVVLRVCQTSGSVSHSVVTLCGEGR